MHAIVLMIPSQSWLKTNLQKVSFCKEAGVDEECYCLAAASAPGTAPTQDAPAWLQCDGVISL